MPLGPYGGSALTSTAGPHLISGQELGILLPLGRIFACCRAVCGKNYEVDVLDWLRKIFLRGGVAVRVEFLFAVARASAGAQGPSRWDPSRAVACAICPALSRSHPLLPRVRIELGTSAPVVQGLTHSAAAPLVIFAPRCPFYLRAPKLCDFETFLSESLGWQFCQGRTRVLGAARVPGSRTCLVVAWRGRSHSEQ